MRCSTAPRRPWISLELALQAAREREVALGGVDALSGAAHARERRQRDAEPEDASSSTPAAPASSSRSRGASDARATRRRSRRPFTACGAPGWCWGGCGCAGGGCGCTGAGFAAPLRGSGGRRPARRRGGRRAAPRRRSRAALGEPDRDAEVVAAARGVGLDLGDADLAEVRERGERASSAGRPPRSSCVWPRKRTTCPSIDSSSKITSRSFGTSFEISVSMSSAERLPP